MSIAVEHERFILTATVERNRRIDAFASEGKRDFAASPSGGNS
jgi:hypothetical protein